MSSDFYRAFEDKFRGSHELIKARLKVYLPFIEPLKNIYPDTLAVDLGCGRGEWLELLGENGFSAQGVDLDDGMLAACRELGLIVQTGEAVAFLKSLPDQSQAVISGFHLAEHIPFDDLQALVEESLRVLKPTGILILETPNPENIVVGTSSFYLDPTHQRPIPPQLLSFLPEYYGFNRIKILRLQESVELINNDNLCLLNVLNGVSPDYAIVAQKNAETELLDVNKEAFEVEYGVTLEKLATTYNQQTEAKANQAETKANQAETKANQAEAKANQAEAKANQAEAKANQAEAKANQAEAKANQAEAKANQAEAKANQAEAKANQAEVKANQAEVKAEQLHTELHSVYTSRSWRITAPLRWFIHQVRLLRQHGLFSRIKALVKKIARPFVRRGITFVDSRPSLRLKCVTLVRKLGLYESLRSIYLRFSRSYQPNTPFSTQSGDAVSGKLQDLTPNARRIYADLKDAIAKQQKIND